MTNFEKIKAFISHKGITVREFERRAGFSIGVISYLRKLNGATTITTLGKIAEAFPDFDVVGFILSENAQIWQKCISTPLPPQKIDKNQISQRLLTFFKEFDLNNWALHLACGFGYGFISTLEKGTAGFTTETLQKIFNGFPELSPQWLILGQGEMLKKGSQKQVNKTIEEILINHLETMKTTEAQILANTQETFNAVSGRVSKEELLALQKERKKIYSQILIQQQQLKKIIREYNEKENEK